MPIVLLCQVVFHKLIVPPSRSILLHPKMMNCALGLTQLSSTTVYPLLHYRPRTWR